MVSDGGFHNRYDGAVGVTLSDEPKLLAVNLVRRNVLQALTRHYLVDLLPQSDVPSEERHFVASGRQEFALVGVSRAWRPPRRRPRPAQVCSAGRLTERRPAFRPFPCPHGITPVSAVPAPPLAAVAATAAPSPALLERLTLKQRVSFLLETTAATSAIVCVRSSRPGLDPCGNRTFGSWSSRFC